MFFEPTRIFSSDSMTSREHHNMNIQEWIPINGTHRLVIKRKLNNADHERCVVLLAGFAQSMCDKNYLMYRLGSDILTMGFEIIHYDPIAHGESCYCLEDINLNIYKSDLQSFLSCVSESYGSKPIVIARGFAASVVASMPNAYDTLIGICPFYINNPTKKHMRKTVEDINSNIIEFADLNHSDLIFMDFINALGSHYNNLSGQLISTKLFLEMIDFNTSQILDKNYICIAPDVDDDFQAINFISYKKEIDKNNLSLKLKNDIKVLERLIDKTSIVLSKIEMSKSQASRLSEKMAR